MLTRRSLSLLSILLVFMPAAATAQAGPGLNPQALPNAAVGVPYSAPILGPPCPSQCSNYIIILNSLPPGLTVNQSTGSISGVPTTTGTYAFRIQANIPNISRPELPAFAFADYQITVTPPAATGAPISPLALSLMTAGLAITGLLAMRRLRCQPS